MSSIKFELLANKRNIVGKSDSKRMRSKHNQVPAVIYGGKAANQHIELNHDHIIKASEHENFYSQILNIIIDGHNHKVVLKDLQRHPFKPKIIHLDFQRVSDTDFIIMQVPLHFIGTEQCPGVKQGGVINHHTNTVEVRCKAQSLPEFIEVDLSKLQLGQILHLSDLILPQHVEIPAITQSKLNIPVVSVHIVKEGTAADSNVSLAGSEVATETSSKDKTGSGANTANKTPSAANVKSEKNKTDKK